MKNLFFGRDTEFCSLIEYVETFLSDQNENFNLFQLPPIQRNSVWNIAQIERLWDSLLRGFPIGSFLITPRMEGQKSRDIYSGVQRASVKQGYFLLDGQQRTRALLLGFKPNLNARLWIDLNPNLNFDTELSDRKFLFRVLTTYQPWGMNDKNPQEKLRESDKFDARMQIGIKQLHYDYQVKIFNELESDFQNHFSWPVKATLPIPFDKLINLCGGTSGTFYIPEWTEVCQLLPDRYKSEITVEPTQHYYEILKGLKSIIEIKKQEIKTRNIVLLLDNSEPQNTLIDQKDPMEVLFVRVNSSGTVLNGEEMAYSLLKSTWDGAYDMVSKIVNSDKIGYLLPSTGLVMSSARVARFILDEKDDPAPGISNFRRWIGNPIIESPFLKTMKELLETDSNKKSIFYKIVETFCSLVLFDENISYDIGIPRKLLLLINPVLLHPVFIWIQANLDNPEHIKQSRNNIIRYLLYSFLTMDNAKNANAGSKIAVSLIKVNKHSDFPDKRIYEEFLDKELTATLPTKELFASPFKLQADGYLRHWNDIFALKNDDNISENISNAFRFKFWFKKEMLLWFQRSYAAKWFIGYNPMSEDNFDTPFDFDHIMPKSHLINHGGYLNIYTEDARKAIFTNNWNKSNYINSIGNYRIWPLWLNRSDNNKCHTVKLRIHSVDLTNDYDAKELGLMSMTEFFEASSINIKDFDLWKEAGGSVKEWPESRRKAWQNAVENRVCWLYQIFFDSLEFKNWILN